jgi:hypothetical protein
MNISSSCPGWTTFIFLSLHGFRGRAKIIKKRKRWRAPRLGVVGQLNSCQPIISLKIYTRYEILENVTIGIR